MIRHTLNYFLSKGLPGLINFLAIAVYTRLLSPNEYGEYALIIASVSMMSSFFFHWLRMGLLRFNPKYQTSNRTIFLSSIAVAFISLLFSSLLIGISIFFVASDVRALSTMWFLGLGLLTVQSIYDIFLELIRSELKSKLYGLITSIKVTGSLILSVLFIKMGFGSSGIIIGLMIGMLLSILFILPNHVKGIRLEQADMSLIKEIVLYSLPFAATLSMEYIFLTSDRFVISFFLGTAETGIYAVSYDLAKQILMMIMMIINLAAYPLVVKALETSGIEASQKQLNMNTTFLLLVSLPAAAGMILLCKPFTEIFLGSEYQGSTSIIFAFVTFSILLQGFKIYYFDLAFQLGRRTSLQIWPVLISAIVNIGLNFFLVPKYGILGSAYSTIFSCGLAIFISSMIGKRIFPLTFPLKEALKITASVAVMCFALLPLLHTDGVFYFAVQIGIGVISYSLMILLLNVAGFQKLLAVRLKR
ncbi:oligosaccharide flippase family protein [Metabacillus idriensis]|uniref:oligosaccharide flippase family protein n=1 Tax=Metabacillus idriensis TaxID=324768 RepID=UPI00174C275F|nr:oligosaccharide flippase family protein [Metabacillus idriensis]